MKKSKNNTVIATIIALIALTLLYCLFYKKPSPDVIKIGIFQTASHPALDKARDGFITKIKNVLGDKVQFVMRNSEGSITNNFVIAESFHSHDEIVGILTLATPATQAMASIEKNKPIFIAAVTDCVWLLKNNNNVFGASDKINIPDTIALMKALVPTVNNVALLAYTGDANSEKEISEIEEELKKTGLTSTRIAFNSEADVPGAILSACGKGDIILTPNYNIIISAMPLVASIALQNKKPLFALDQAAVEQGALAANGIDYFMNGQQAAESALEIFFNKDNTPDASIKTQKGSFFINQCTADSLGIIIPNELNCTIIS